MKVRALRGVCVGVEQHLAAGAVADLDPAQVPFLVSIGAVERLPEEPAATGASSQAGSAPAADADPDSQTTAPAKPGKKEK